MNVSIRSFFIICAALAIEGLLSSCDESTVYDSYTHTSVSGWEKNEQLCFDIPHAEKTGTYSIGIGLRATDAFPFTNLSLVIEQKILPSGKTITDTLNCALTDVNGNILGKGVGCYQYDFSLKDIHLNKNDSLHIVIRHAMKRDILPGVSDIGLKLSRR
ncbi:MAG: gliding motility lipoprotein GldH [Prevotella sp.]|nr:gliding motility lipoprotein GldH [Prevotella sp.]